MRPGRVPPCFLAMARAKDELSRLARRCASHGTPEMREALAEQTVKLARAAVGRLAQAAAPPIPWCDLDCIAIDAAAWCMGRDSLRRFECRDGGAWSTHVYSAVRREASRQSYEHERFARLRDTLADLNAETLDEYEKEAGN